MAAAEAVLSIIDMQMRALSLRSVDYEKKEDEQIEKVHDKGVWTLAILGDSSYASGAYSGRTGLHRPNKTQIVSDHRQTSTLCVMAQTDRLLLSAGGSGKISMFVMPEFKKMGELIGHFTGAYSLAKVKVNEFASGSCQFPQGRKNPQWDYDIRLWDVGKMQPTSRLKGHEGAVSEMAYLDDRNCLVSASADHTVKYWDPREGKSVLSTDAHKDYVYSVASLDDGCVATGSRDRSVKLWDIRKLTDTGSVTPLKEIPAHESTVYSVAKAANGHFVTGSRDGTVKIFNQKGDLIRAEGFNQFVYRVRTLPNGDIIAGLGDGSIATLKYKKNEA